MSNTMGVKAAFHCQRAQQQCKFYDIKKSIRTSIWKNDATSRRNHQKYDPIIYTYDDYAHDLRENLKYSWKLAKEKLVDRKIKNKRYFDQKHNTKNLNLQKGDMVLMKNHHRQNKYDTAYVGPYEVIELTGPNTVTLKNKNKTIRAHKDHLKKYFSNESDDEDETSQN